MFRYVSLLLCFTLCHSSIVYAENHDGPAADETFSQFFWRVTSGNHKYRGLTFNASERFQNTFLPRYPLGAWVGDQNRVEKELVGQSVNLWGDWFVTPTPAKIALPNRAVFNEVDSGFRDLCAHDGGNCRTLSELIALPWKVWSVSERGLFTKSYVLQARIFAGRRLVDFIADNYDVLADDALQALDVKILNHEGFVSEVRKLGWTGDVYFRGITAPEPGNGSRMIILLDGDFLRDQTEYTSALLQMYEYIGVLTHEMNHVFQNLESRRMGLDLKISSLEGLVLIEGGAEYLAEQEMQRASLTLPAPSPLALYATQQAIGVVGKDAEKDYYFLPYRMGVPFVYTLYHLGSDAAKIRSEMYATILGTESLTELAQKLTSAQGAVGAPLARSSVLVNENFADVMVVHPSGDF